MVGNELIEEPAEIVSDTIDVTATSETRIRSFSGNLAFFSAGWYDDQLFGEQKVTGIMQPSIDFADGAGMPDDDGSPYLILEVEEIYGDVNATAEFDIVQIEQRWRGDAWRPDSIPELGTRVIGSFEVAGQDSIAVELDDDGGEWFEQYHQHYHLEEDRRDQYKTSMFGLALVPKNTAKIVSFVSQNTLLHVDNPEEDEEGEQQEDFYTGMRAWGYSLDREEPEQELDDSVTRINNTFENILRLDFTVDEHLFDARNIARAELVLTENHDLLESTLPDGHRRPEVESLHIHFLDDEEAQISVLDDPTFSPGRTEDDELTFRSNLTGYVNNQLFDTPDEGRFYIISGGNDGRIVPSLLYNHRADESHPRILITSASPTD